MFTFVIRVFTYGILAVVTNLQTGLYFVVICRDYVIGKKTCLKPLLFGIVLYRVPQNKSFVFLLKSINTGEQT